jgi:carbonic anhydrase
MDYRIQTAIDAWIKEQKYEGDIDRISVGGSCKEEQLALANIRLAAKLHEVETVVLTQHEDCGTYGGQASWESREAERQALVADMKDLKRQVAEALPKVAIRTLWIGREGSGWALKEV